MQHSQLIYISHHPSEASKAKEVANALRQIKNLSSDEIGYTGNTLPGDDIEKYADRWISSADIILVLVSHKYLADCADEISQIKASDCYKKEKVIPAPISACLWKDYFPQKMPLPKEAVYTEIPFGEDWLFQVVVGVKSLMPELEDSKHRYIPLMLARADSSVHEESQEFPEETLGLSLGPGEILVPIRGNSMSPVFEEGDYVICKPIDSMGDSLFDPKRKKIFVIRTCSQGTLLKYLGNIGADQITLVSENPNHEDIQLYKTEIERIYIVVRSVKIRPE